MSPCRKLRFDQQNEGNFCFYIESMFKKFHHNVFREEFFELYRTISPKQLVRRKTSFEHFLAVTPSSTFRCSNEQPKALVNSLKKIEGVIFEDSALCKVILRCKIPRRALSEKVLKPNDKDLNQRYKVCHKHQDNAC